MSQSVSPQQELRYCFNKISTLYLTNYIRTIVERHHHHHQTRHKAHYESAIVVNPSIAFCKKRLGDDGEAVGRDDGTVEGLLTGTAGGARVGSLEGITVGSLEGLTVGMNVGLKVG
jgi:hypothetical protein